MKQTVSPSHIPLFLGHPVYSQILKQINFSTLTDDNAFYLAASHQA